MFKYKINILEALKKAGYSSYRLRKEKTLGEGTLQKMRSGDTSLTLDSLDVICEILDCQLTDLLEWVPNEPADE